VQQKFWYQKAVNIAGIVVGSAIGLLALADTLSGAAKFITLPIPVFGTALLIALFLLAEVLPRVAKIKWVVKDGAVVTLTRPGWRTRLVILGWIVALWIPRALPGPSAPEPVPADTPSPPSPTANSQDLAFAADRVRLCMQAHELASQKEFVEATAASFPTDGELEPGEPVANTRIAYCQWPPSPYSEADGYVEITVETVIGPGRGQVTGATYADRVLSHCDILELAYGFGKQGVSGHHSFDVAAGSIVDVDGNAWDPDTMNENPEDYYPEGLLWMGFYTQRGEVVVMRNATFYLEDASCVP